MMMMMMIMMVWFSCMISQFRQFLHQGACLSQLCTLSSLSKCSLLSSIKCNICFFARIYFHADWQSCDFSRRSCIRATWRHRLYVTVSSACRGARALSTWKKGSRQSAQRITTHLQWNISYNLIKSGVKGVGVALFSIALRYYYFFEAHTCSSYYCCITLILWQ